MAAHEANTRMPARMPVATKSMSVPHTNWNPGREALGLLPSTSSACRHVGDRHARAVLGLSRRGPDAREARPPAPGAEEALELAVLVAVESGDAEAAGARPGDARRGDDAALVAGGVEASEQGPAALAAVRDDAREGALGVARTKRRHLALVVRRAAAALVVRRRGRSVLASQAVHRRVRVRGRRPSQAWRKEKDCRDEGDGHGAGHCCSRNLNLSHG
eukprot:CAMPEP_0171233310 /NCGR_PEP_ID=MMETSP0790-20130122/40854_1 /TAXON_ID=2925 /ORGANISM="Alexandrium catenella, Strain OF101" /LENGTH=217 /DNA_ID=CAMNT_0011699565 /DNA_START=342 /DNA_END=993 /DNA_ORIENTATION=+